MHSTSLNYGLLCTLKHQSTRRIQIFAVANKTNRFLLPRRRFDLQLHQSLNRKASPPVSSVTRNAVVTGGNVDTYKYVRTQRLSAQLEDLMKHSWGFRKSANKTDMDSTAAARDVLHKPVKHTNPYTHTHVYTHPEIESECINLKCEANKWELKWNIRNNVTNVVRTSLSRITSLNRRTSLNKRTSVSTLASKF